jgi:hypothetical protein
MRLIVAAAAVLISCSDSGPDSQLGSVFFAYSGASGSPFSVSGAQPADQQAAMSSDWASGRHEDGGVRIYSQRTSHGAGQNDLAIISLDPTAGTQNIDSDCSADLCAGMGATLQGKVCVLTDGSLTVLSFSETRIKGTFSGTGVCTSGVSVTETTTFSTAGGTFDAPLRMVDETMMRYNRKTP